MWPPWLLNLAATLFVVVFLNLAFFRHVAAVYAGDQPAFIGSLAVLVFCLILLPVTLLESRVTRKPLLVALLLFSSVTAYFMDQYSVVIDKEMEKKKFKSKMIMQVHDELVFEVVPGELDDLKSMVVEKMESAAKLKVDLKVDVDTGKNWAEAH